MGCGASSSTGGVQSKPPPANSGADEPVPPHFQTSFTLIQTSYTDLTLEIVPTEAIVAVPLVAVKRMITTPWVRVGHSHGGVGGAAAVVASLALWYEYNPEQNVLTFCSVDLNTPDSTRLRLKKEGTADEMTTQSTFEPAAIGTPVDVALQKVLRDSVRGAQQHIIEAALAAGFHVIERTPFPTLPAALEEKLTIVKGSDGKVKGTVEGLGGGAVPADHRKIPLASVWHGTLHLGRSPYVASVMDQRVDSTKTNGPSWVELWFHHFGALAAPSGQGSNASAHCTTINCDGPSSIVGGQVTLGAVPPSTTVTHVFFAPMCTHFNNQKGKHKKPFVFLRGCALQNYHDM